jgi:hypothetical protein
MTERVELIKKIEVIRGSRVICYLTSLRPNVNASMASDAVRVMADHLNALDVRPVEKLDIFLASNGGSGTVPWRLTALFREFSKKFSVIIPYRAYSAATLLALGADEIVMHPFGEMGPIDPTVSNAFNPREKTGQPIGISVEDVKAYVSFIKDTVGIRHEDELVKAIEVLANNVHPLALGNVERFVSQSRMTAKKIMRTHMTEADEHVIDEIVENLASRLYFHGHPINRREAKHELKLKIAEDPSPELEATIWELYKSYEKEFENRDELRPVDDLLNSAIPPFNGSHRPAAPQPVPAPPVPPVAPNITLPFEIRKRLLFAMIEDGNLMSRYDMEKRYILWGLQNANAQIQELTESAAWVTTPQGSAPSRVQAQVAKEAQPSRSPPASKVARKNAKPSRKKR